MDSSDVRSNDMVEAVTVAEEGPLGRKLAIEFRNSWEFWAMMRGENVDATDDALEKLRLMPADEVEWRDLSPVCNSHVAAAFDKWEDIKAAARAELTSGYRSFNVLRVIGDRPIDRARFLMLRESFIEEWQPRGGIEMSLIDNMAQAQTLQEYFTRQALTRQCEDSVRDEEAYHDHCKKKQRDPQYGLWIRPRVTTAEAIAEASLNADRWNRVYIRVLRQLRDLRRYNVVINNAGQLNLADRQIVASNS